MSRLTDPARPLGLRMADAVYLVVALGLAAWSVAVWFAAPSIYFFIAWGCGGSLVLRAIDHYAGSAR